MINLLTKIYYPNKIQDYLVNFINKNNCDIVIGAEGYYSAFLAVKKERFNCKVYGWQHNSFEAYFNTPKKYYWNRDELYKEYINNLDEYIVLTKADKKKLKDTFNINSKVIYNPISFKTKDKSKCINKNIISVGRFTR